MAIKTESNVKKIMRALGSAVAIWAIASATVIVFSLPTKAVVKAACFFWNLI